jgi:hypothetical protein
MYPAWYGNPVFNAVVLEYIRRDAEIPPLGEPGFDNTVLQYVNQFDGSNDDNDDSLPEFPRGIRGGQGESPEHRALKEYVAKNPESLFGLKGYERYAVPEKYFPSRDRVDVYFEHPQKPVAVECKAANASDDDLASGIFQCVKYRALLEAEYKWKRLNFSPRCILAVGRPLPPRYVRLAKLLNVEYVEVTI